MLRVKSIKLVAAIVLFVLALMASDCLAKTWKELSKKEMYEIYMEVTDHPVESPAATRAMERMIKKIQCF